MQHDAMPACMAGRRYDAKTRLNHSGRRAIEDDLRIALRGRVSLMDYTSGAEVAGEPVGIRHVVLMGQEDVANPTHRLEAAHQM